MKRHVAYDTIRAKILSGEFAPGATLVEADLAQSLGISRTPVREALLRLQEDGLASLLPKRGAVVRVLSVRESHEVLLVRGALEGTAASLAASRFDVAALAELRAHWEKLLQTVTERPLDEVRAFGVEFHARLVEVADNRTLARLLESVRGQIEAGQHLFVKTSGEQALRRARLICEDHLQIIDALEHRDPGLAEARMRQHMMGVAAEMVGVMPGTRT